MNSCIILPTECVEEEKAVVTGARARYLFERHELRTGQSVKIGILGGKSGRGLVTLGSELRFEIEYTLSDDPIPRLPVSLIVAIPRPQTIKKVIAYSTMLGVRELFLTPSERSQKNYLQSKSLRPGEIEEQIIMALEQSCGTLAPVIEIKDSLPECLKNFADENTGKFFGDGTSSTNLFECARRKHTSSVLALGPELGWSHSELTLLTDRGFTGFSLGPRMLRVEVALAAALGQLQVLVTP